MKNNIKEFAQQVQKVIGSENCRLSGSVVAQISENTLGFYKAALGIVFPQSITALKELLQICNFHRISIHAISQGKNVGYGDMTPAQDYQLIVSLSGLNQISDYNPDDGSITVGPGVTQQQLCDFLVENGGRFWADMTGASPGASIVGNTIEAGFGHTPLGDHRKHILGMECVLINGQEFNCCDMPAPGPDLAQLFIQTNYAIVTALKIPLFKVPEVALTYTISFDTDEQLFSGLDCLRELKLSGLVESLVHIGNSTRSLMTSFTFPDEIDKSQTLSESDCRQILKNRLGLDPGAWTAVGCLYGYKLEVQEKAVHLENALKKYGRIRFLSDIKINLIERFINWKVFNKSKRIQFIKKSFSTLKAIHGIMRGTPSATPSKNILWRNKSTDHCGLIWHSPVATNNKEQIQELIHEHRQIFAKYGFEMPVTLTMVSSRKVILVFNINFDRCSVNDVQRAHGLYKELAQITQMSGNQSYRYSLLGQPVRGLTSTKSQILLDLKRVFDPFNLLAPGRYGLDLKSVDEEKENSKNYSFGHEVKNETK